MGFIETKNHRDFSREDRERQTGNSVNSALRANKIELCANKTHKNTAYIVKKAMCKNLFSSLTEGDKSFCQI